MSRPGFNFDMYFGRVLMYPGSANVIREKGTLMWRCPFEPAEGEAVFLYLAQGDTVYYEAKSSNTLKEMNRFTVFKHDENLKPVSPWRHDYAKL